MWGAGVLQFFVCCSLNYVRMYDGLRLYAINGEHIYRNANNIKL